MASEIYNMCYEQEVVLEECLSPEAILWLRTKANGISASPMFILPCMLLNCTLKFKLKIFLAILSMVGGFAGNRCTLLLTEGWTVPPILWTVVLARSGNNKSGACKIMEEAMVQFEDEVLGGTQNLWARRMCIIIIIL